MGVGEGALVAVGVRWRAVPVVTDRRDDAVAALFDEHYAGLCRLATLLLADRGQAEEAVQEAFLRTFVGWRRLRHPERAGAYLRTAVVNQCRSRGRRRATEQRGNAVLWTDVMDDAGQSDVERTGEVLAVLDAVRSLPTRQREAVVLRYYADLSEAEVAQALGCSVGTVKSQLSKARATLSRLLEGTDDAAQPAGVRDE
jgi:RNA polymerase sigma-70 factor (sigma-E family)